MLSVITTEWHCVWVSVLNRGQYIGKLIAITIVFCLSIVWFCVCCFCVFSFCFVFSLLRPSGCLLLISHSSPEFRLNMLKQQNRKWKIKVQQKGKKKKLNQANNDMLTKAWLIMKIHSPLSQQTSIDNDVWIWFVWFLLLFVL